jgi:two-component system, OmpR family, sensor histidine kinase TctE
VSASGLIATGWPLALLLGAILLGSRARDARRRRAIEAALHELRRPLQALALGAGHGVSTNGNGPPPLELAICALADLDRAVNGVERQPPTRRLLRLRPLVEGCLERWMPAAELNGCELGLEWRAGAAAVVADPRRLAQALDNLVANALEHGGPPVVVGAVVFERGVRIAVSDSGAAGHDVRRRRARRHNGLRIVAAIASECGGRFAIDRGGDGTVAVLELPLASLPLPVARAA